MIHTVRRIADALLRAYDPDGLNLIQNNGVVAGQNVSHFHMHVVPRRKVGSDWGNGPPHIAVLEGKTPTKPDRDVLVSLEEEHEIAPPHPAVPGGARMTGRGVRRCIHPVRAPRYAPMIRQP